MIPIVFAVDGKERSRRWLEVALRTARKYLPVDTKLIVFTDSKVTDFGYGSSAIQVADVVKRCGLDRLEGNRNFHGEPIPPMQFLRFAFPVMAELSPYDKIVYADIDVEFCDERASGIFDIDVDGYDCAATIERTRYALQCDSRMRHAYDDPLAKEESVRRLKGGRYANSGVMVMNLKHLREWVGVEEIRRFVEIRNEYKFGCVDQDVINLCWRVKELPEEYNWLVMLEGCGANGFIRHYAGDQKINSPIYPPLLPAYRSRPAVEVMYVVTKPTAHDDIELRWSLRALAKNGKNVGRVIVASEVKREWLSEQVVQVAVPVLPGNQYKHKDMLNKVMVAMDEAGIQGEFLVSSDDHFYMKEVDFAHYGFGVRNWNIDRKNRRGRSFGSMLWNTSMMDTAKFLYEHNLPTVDFQGHWNAHWNADIVRAHKKMFEESQQLRFGVEPNVLMGNLWLNYQSDIPLVLRKDMKVDGYSNALADAECVSCWDKTLKDRRFVDFMNQGFGEKCRFEK